MANRNDDNQKGSTQSQREELRQQDGDFQHASPDQGGTTDLKNNTGASSAASSSQGNSSSITKRNVTGSDYDGQVSS